MTDRLEAVRYDYLTNRMSLSQLAQKYGIHKSSVNRLVKKHGWDVEKKMMESQIVVAAKKKTEKPKAEHSTPKRETAPKTETTETKQHEGPREEMVLALGEYIDIEAERRAAVYAATDLLLEQVHRMLQEAQGAMAPRDLQAMSSTLMNIKQLHDIKPDEEDRSKSIMVTLDGPLDEWAG